MKFQPGGKDKFLFLYQGENGTLNDHQRQGMTDLLRFIESDDDLVDPRQVAYCLATVRHETANLFLPIAEYGRGKGRQYGEPAENGKIFYGRGYVQLTWADNYKTMSPIVGHDLYHDPDAAMIPHVAYEIMSYGMRHGSFTGKALSRYINDEKCDYRNARRIINGVDCAAMIAEYAERFESMISECV